MKRRKFNATIIRQWPNQRGTLWKYYKRWLWQILVSMTSLIVAIVVYLFFKKHRLRIGMEVVSHVLLNDNNDGDARFVSSDMQLPLSISTCGGIYVAPQDLDLPLMKDITSGSSSYNSRNARYIRGSRFSDKNDSGRVILLPEFLSEEELNEFVSYAHSRSSSKTEDPNQGGTWTQSTTILTKVTTPLQRRVLQRLQPFTKLSVDCAERWLYREVESRTQNDDFDSKEEKRITNQMSQDDSHLKFDIRNIHHDWNAPVGHPSDGRIVTAVIYIEEPKAGGGLVFMDNTDMELTTTALRKKAYNFLMPYNSESLNSMRNDYNFSKVEVNKIKPFAQAAKELCSYNLISGHLGTYNNFQINSERIKASSEFVSNVRHINSNGIFKVLPKRRSAIVFDSIWMNNTVAGEIKPLANAYHGICNSQGTRKSISIFFRLTPSKAREYNLRTDKIFHPQQELEDDLFDD